MELNGLRSKEEFMNKINQYILGAGSNRKLTDDNTLLVDQSD
jgi:hypothetical protein